MPEHSAPQRLGTLAILVTNRAQVSTVNALISQHEHLILGRIGLPYRKKSVSIIVLLVEGTTDELGAFSGKLGSVPGIKSRSAVFHEEMHSSRSFGDTLPGNTLTEASA